MSDALTQADLKETLDYDPATGHFWWRSPGKKRILSRPAGCNHAVRKYREIRLKVGQKDRLYKAHRLAFLSSIRRTDLRSSG